MSGECPLTPSRGALPTLLRRPQDLRTSVDSKEICVYPFDFISLEFLECSLESVVPSVVCDTGTQTLPTLNHGVSFPPKLLESPGGKSMDTTQISNPYVNLPRRLPGRLHPDYDLGVVPDVEPLQRRRRVRGN